MNRPLLIKRPILSAGAVIAIMIAGILVDTDHPATVTVAEAAGIVLPIDLVRRDTLELQSMGDPRWGAGVVQGIGGAKTFGSCGCWLAVLSTIFTNQTKFPSGSLPQYATVLPNGSSDLSFSPVYLDDWAFDRDGYTANPDHRCGTSIDPDVFEGSAAPVRSPEGSPITPTGFTWTTKQGFGPEVRAMTDAFLNRGWPVAARIEYPAGDGNIISHMVLIVGFDPRLGADGQYLFLDPAASTGSMPISFGAGGTETNADNETYGDWLGWVQEVRLVEPVYGSSSWFGLFDDPEPIELLVTDPLGRRTGRDPSTGQVYNEQPDGSYETANGWQDPSGTTAATEPDKRFWVRNPIDGVYAVEVIGTGAGNWTLDVWNGAGLVTQTLSGTTELGDIHRYEIEIRSGRVMNVQAVAAFGVRSEAGPDQVTVPGATIHVDGYRSWAPSTQPIASYEWDFGDGSTATGRAASHSYAAGGTYTVSLTVVDTAGARATDSLAVHSRVPPPPGRVTSMLSTSPTDPLSSAVSTGAEFSSVALTGDGRYAALTTAHRLAIPPAGDSENYGLFRTDLSTGAVQLITGAGANVRAVSDISDDGNLITFIAGGALVPGDTNGVNDVYLVDVAAGTFERIGVATDGTPFEGTDGGSMSGDGRFVLFNQSQVYLRDRVAGTTRRVSELANGTAGSAASGPGAVSDDGTVVAFPTFALNLIGSYGEANVPFILVRDLAAGTVKEVYTGGNSRNVYRVEISGDGRYVAFLSNGQQWIPFEQRTTFVTPEPYLFDRVTSKITWLAPTIDGVRPVSSGYSWGGYDIDISSNGEWVAFEHRAANVIAGDTNGTADMFVYHVPDGVLTRESVTTGGDQSAGVVSWFARSGVDDTGGTIFTSTARDLAPEIVTYLTDWNIYRRGIVAGGSNGSPSAEFAGPYVGFASADSSPAAIVLDGRRSVDPEGDELTGTIEFGDATGAAGLIGSHPYGSSGQYVATLTVTDGGREASDTAEVTVFPSALPDTVYAPVCAGPGDVIVIGGVGRTANAALVAEGWNTSVGPTPLAEVGVTTSWAGGTTAMTTLPTLAFTTVVTAPTTAGRYSVTLDGTDASASFDVPCLPNWNERPIADAGGPYRVVSGTALVLDGSRSVGAMSFAWKFGDGATAHGATPAHTFTTPGWYEAQLVVGGEAMTTDQPIEASVTGLAGLHSSTGLFAWRSRAVIEVVAPPTSTTGASTITSPSSPVTTPQPSAMLPATGAETRPTPWIATASILLGLLLVMASLRRRSPAPARDPGSA